MSRLIFYSILIIPLIINIALTTLLERKILSQCQIRIGPIKVGYIGVLQPISDVLKLFSSQFSTTSYQIKSIYFIRPFISLIISIIFILTLPLSLGELNFEYVFLTMLTILRLNIYPLLLRGWSSNSIYSFIGSIRGVVQTISYEIRLSLIILSFFLIFIFKNFMNINLKYNYSKLFYIPLILIWIIRIIAELNRTPFDFSEGESELVSGFNIEYGSLKFSLLFIAEYLIINLLCLISSVIFLEKFVNNLMLLFLWLFLIYLVIWSRSSIPRFRYDKLIILAWKKILPLSLTLIQIFCLINLLL